MSSTPQREPISADTYSPATVRGIYGRRTLLGCVNLSPKLTSPGVGRAKVKCGMKKCARVLAELTCGFSAAET